MNWLTPLTPEVYGAALRGFVKIVTIADPHSVTGRRILAHVLDNRVVNTLDPGLYLPKLLPLDYYDFVVQPDDGAESRT